MNSSNFLPHRLKKINSRAWECQCCKQIWKGKPRAACPGCPVVEYEHVLANKFWQLDSLEKLNLRPVTKACCVKDGRDYHFYYDKQGKTEIIDRTLPPVVESSVYFHRPQSKIDSYLKSKMGLTAMNLTPNDAQPVAMYWERADRAFATLYNPLDCEILYQNMPKLRGSWPEDRGLIPVDSYPLEHWQRQNLRPRMDARPACAIYKANDWEFYYFRADCEIDDCDLPTIYSSFKLPKHLYKHSQLRMVNRLATATTPAKGCYWCTYHDGFQYLYDPQDCMLIDESLPTCYDCNNIPAHLRTQWSWSQMQPLYELSANTVAQGCFKRWNKYRKRYETVMLYAQEQLVTHNRDILISKAKLKQNYLLSDGWIKKLGDPDCHHPNPVDSRFAPMQMYSRYRIERYLADNAEAYTSHLAKRNTYLAIFEKNKDKLLSPESRAKAKQTKKIKKKIGKVTEQFDWNYKNKLVQSQSIKCLSCASGIAGDRGFLCAINPMGLDLDWLPCPDWRKR